MAATSASASVERQFFGHPRGLSTLFFTEVWERFSYYGMRGLLILFMTDTVSGGLGMGIETAAAIYALYTFGVYALALPGGWIADRLTGKKKAILYGGIVIALGHFALAVPSLWTFYSGLLLIAVGTGLLKPNVSAVVGDLYTDSGARRDAGFSIFYMGINIGAFAGPLVCSYLGEQINWHLGFSAAGVGMTLGLVQYVAGQKHLEGAGDLHFEAASEESRSQAATQLLQGVGTLAVLSLVLAVLNSGGMFPVTLVGFAQATGAIVSVLVAIYFMGVISLGCRDSAERKRVGLIAILFLGAALFWSAFEQAGSSMNLFARDFTDRIIAGWEMPAGVLQAVNPFFIIILAPVMGMFWVWLRSCNPSIPVKFGAGLVLLGVGFLVLAWGAGFIDDGGVSPMWLVVTYFFHTVGELCLSPVGLSSITKLSPDRYVGQMMGIWFMGTALGNLIAGLVAGYLETMPTDQLFSTVATIVIGSGLVFLVFAMPIRKLQVGVS